MKETKLNESADIYQKREILTEKQKLKEMSFKQKIGYFNDYYRNKLIAGIFFGGLLISLIVTILSPKDDPVLYAAIINDVLDEEKVTALQDDFATYLELDPENNPIFLDSSFYLGDESSMDQNSIASQQRFSTYLSTSQIDVIITDEEQFNTCVEVGYMQSLSDCLPTDLYSDLSDAFYISDTKDDSTEKAYGIYLDENTVYKELGSVIQKPVMGIVLNSQNKENSVEFLKYLFKKPF